MRVAYTLCDLCDARYPQVTKHWNVVHVVGWASEFDHSIDICPTCNAALARDGEALRDFAVALIVAGLRADIRHGIGPDDEGVAR